MGLCCCKDWREHLRAPKGNSRCARAPRARDLCASVRSARRRLPPAAAGGYYLLIPDLSASFPGPPDTCRSLGKDSGRVSELWSAHSRVALAPRCQLEPGAGPWAGEERCGAHSGHPLQVRQVHAGEEESRVPCPAPPHTQVLCRGSRASARRRLCGLTARERIHSFSSASVTNLDPWALSQSFPKVAPEPVRGAAYGMQRLGESSQPRNNAEDTDKGPASSGSGPSDLTLD